MKTINDLGHQERLTHITNLISMARIDGEIADTEKLAICHLATRWGITDEEFEQCARDSVELKTVVPEKESDKVAFLRNLTALMLIDEKIDRDELEVLRYLVHQFGFAPSAVDVLVEDVLKEMYSRTDL